jgi:hypothetical protein
MTTITTKDSTQIHYSRVRRLPRRGRGLRCSRGHAHDGRRAPQVEPEPPRRAGDPDHGLVARGAAQDGAQLDRVEPQLRHRHDPGAARAGRPRGRRLEREHLAQQAARGVAVEHPELAAYGKPYSRFRVIRP